MQAVQTWRNTHAVTTIAAVAVLLLLTLALVYVAFDSSGESISGSDTSTLGDYSVDRATFLEQNMAQIPYTPPRVLSEKEISILNQGMVQIPSTLPQVLSAEEIAFWEANTLQQPYTEYVAGPHKVAGGNEGAMSAPSVTSETNYTTDPYTGSLTEH